MTIFEVLLKLVLITILMFAVGWWLDLPVNRNERFREWWADCPLWRKDKK